VKLVEATISRSTKTLHDVLTHKTRAHAARR
jgi:hypothetical protein